MPNPDPAVPVPSDEELRATDWGHERKGPKDPWAVVVTCALCGPLSRVEFDNGTCVPKIIQVRDRTREATEAKFVPIKITRPEFQAIEEDDY